MSWDAYQREVLRELGHDVYGLLHTATPVAADIDGEMLARVAKAAGLQPQVLLAQLDSPAVLLALHGNAAAKRALWPRLRALRRAAR